ncbi:DUF6641 family protein [Yoonia sp.]|uniref:DUF6641 family protein n=1 Tax=Yoonia sp. TaxID=2212373 RepID=UPI004047F78D
MTHLAKLTFKTVSKSIPRDPVIARRDKVIAALEEQALVLAAALEGQDHIKLRSKWMINDQGERVLVRTQRRVKPWFFAQDSGWYVQCRYGARVISVDGKNNAVFVNTLKDVAPVLEAFVAAATAGELDTVLAKATERQPRLKPGAARASANE